MMKLSHEVFVFLMANFSCVHMDSMIEILAKFDVSIFLNLKPSDEQENMGSRMSIRVDEPQLAFRSMNSQG